MRWWPALAMLALAACSHRTPNISAAPSPRYVVGAAYQLGGVWSYPQESFRYEATGLADRLPERGGLTTDGERADPATMAGAHRTLQLPAIVDVTNLESGRQIRIRLTDRGPATPGRVLGLTRRAAELLGIPQGAAIPVRIELDSIASQALRDQLGGGPRGMTAAPVESVSQEALPAPGQPRPSRVALERATEPMATSVERSLERLPETVRIVPFRPGQLWVRVGDFTQLRYAEALKNKISGLPLRVQREGPGRQPGYVVLAGPFASVASADAGLDQVRASGVTDATIVVE